MAEITIRAFAKFREIFGAETVISVPDGSTVLDSLVQFAKTAAAAEDEIFEGGVFLQLLERSATQKLTESKEKTKG